MSLPRVEILYFGDCPNHAAARALVERIAAELQVETDTRLIEVDDPDAGSVCAFSGRPRSGSTAMTSSPAPISETTSRSAAGSIAVRGAFPASPRRPGSARRWRRLHE
jgi:hypothetical protein